MDIIDFLISFFTIIILCFILELMGIHLDEDLNNNSSNNICCHCYCIKQES